MKVKELIQKLSKLDEDLEVMLEDESHGYYYPSAVCEVLNLSKDNRHPYTYWPTFRTPEDLKGVVIG